MMRNQARSIVLLAVIAAGLGGGCSSTGRAGKSDPPSRGGSTAASGPPPPDVARGRPRGDGAPPAVGRSAALRAVLARPSAGRLESRAARRARDDAGAGARPARAADPRRARDRRRSAGSARRRVRRGPSPGQGSLAAPGSVPPRRRRRGRGLGLPWSGARRRSARSSRRPTRRAAARAAAGAPPSRPPPLRRGRRGAPRSKRSRSKGSPPPIAALRRRALLALVESARAPQRPVFSRLLGDDDAVVRALAAAGLGASGDGRRSRGAARGQRRRRSRRGDRGRRRRRRDRARGASGAARRLAPDAARTSRRSTPRHARRRHHRCRRLAARSRARGGARARGARRSLRRSAAALWSPWRALARPPPATSPSRRRVIADPWVRAAAARAAGSLEAFELLDRLAADDSAQVRESAFAARAELEARPRPDLYTRYLADPATGVRASVLDRLATAPVVPFEPILNAFAKDERSSPELALAGVAALRARAESAPTERGSIVAALEGLAEVGTYPVRIGAADAAESLGRPRPAVGTATTARSPERLPQHGGADSSAAMGPPRDQPRRRRPAPRCRARLRSSRSRSSSWRSRASTTAPRSIASFPGSASKRATPTATAGVAPASPCATSPSPRRLEPGAFGLVRPAAHAAGSRFFVQLGPDADRRGRGDPVGTGGVRSRRPGGAARGRPHRPRCARSRLPLS